MSSIEDALLTLFVKQEPFIDMGYDAFLLSELLVDTKTEAIFSIINEHKTSLPKVVSNNIPQFSNSEDIYKVMRVVLDSEIVDLSYEKIGYFLCPKGSKSGAQTKYGENHYKLAAQLGLVTPNKPLSTTDLGIAYYLTEDSEKRKEMMKRLVMRIPIIQQVLLCANSQLVDMSEYMCRFLSQSTMLRRRSNMRALLSYLMDISEVPMQHRLNNIVWG